MSKYETEVILLAWNVSAGSHGHWVKFKLPVAITEGHPFALFDTGAENGQRFRMTFEAIGNDELPQGIDSGSAPPVADAEGSPASAPDGGSTPVTSRCPTPQAQACGAAEPATISRSSEKTSCPQREASAFNGAVEQQRNTRGVTAGETASKPKIPWDQRSPSQQAGIACASDLFQAWMTDRRISSPTGGTIIASGPGPECAASAVRYICGVSSRADLDTNSEAAKRWRELYGRFTADTTYGDRR